MFKNGVNKQFHTNIFDQRQSSSELQETKQEKCKQLEEALQNNREEVPKRLQEYYEAQTKLRKEKENQQTSAF